MNWNLDEAIAYYKKQGAPGDQTALTSLLREIQSENGGSIPAHTLDVVAEALAIKVSLLQALIKRIPSLRLENTYILSLCAGPNCGKHKALAAYAEKLQKESGGKFKVQYSSCMRMCGKGPNIKWCGVIYHQANEALLKKLVSELDKKA